MTTDSRSLSQLDWAYESLGSPPISPTSVGHQVPVPVSNRSSSSSLKHAMAVDTIAEGICPRSEAISHASRDTLAVTYTKILPPQPKPPMSKSGQKILQLTGHEVRNDRALQDELSEFLDSSSIESMSVYS